MPMAVSRIRQQDGRAAAAAVEHPAVSALLHEVYVLHRHELYGAHPAQGEVEVGVELVLYQGRGFPGIQQQVADEVRPSVGVGRHSFIHCEIDAVLQVAVGGEVLVDGSHSQLAFRKEPVAVGTHGLADSIPFEEILGHALGNDGGLGAGQGLRISACQTDSEYFHEVRLHHVASQLVSVRFTGSVVDVERQLAQVGHEHRSGLDVGRGVDDVPGESVGQDTAESLVVPGAVHPENPPGGRVGTVEGGLVLHMGHDDDECGEGHYQPREVDGRGQGIPPEGMGQIPDDQSEHGV